MDSQHTAQMRKRSQQTSNRIGTELGGSRRLTRSKATRTETAPESPPVTKTTASSTYQPSTGRDCYGLQNLAHVPKRAEIRKEMEDLWTKATPGLMDLFFPDNDHVSKCVEALRGKYTGDIVDAGSIRGSRWSDFPQISLADLLDEQKRPILERNITAAFVPIWNTIIETLGLSESRVAVDGQNFQISTRDGGQLKPDAFLWGARSRAIPNIEGKPETIARSREKKKKDAKTNDSETQESPDIDWLWCCAPVEIKTSKARGGVKNLKAPVQLGTYVREVFVAQTNRSFVPSLILTEHTIEFLLWDRSGAVFSERINFHQKPRLFCRILVNLASWTDRELGFDASMFYNNNNDLCIESYERTGQKGCRKVIYTVEEVLFRSYTLGGRATTAWRCLSSRDPDGGPHYIILDSWIERSAGDTYAFGPALDIIGKLEKKDVDFGGDLVHVEEVRAAFDLSPRERPGLFPLDSVRNNRGDVRLKVAYDSDLVHTRFVWKYNGVLLENFTQTEELLYAVKGIAHTLRDMFLKASVVHRDMAPWNILIPQRAFARLPQRNTKLASHDGERTMHAAVQPEREAKQLEGKGKRHAHQDQQPAHQTQKQDQPTMPRSFLFDFCCAAVVDGDFVSPRSHPTPGANLFMSHNALQKRPTNHLDDLQSLYWILCFIITGHKGPELGKSRLREMPSEVRMWLADEAQAALAKKGHLAIDFELPIQDHFISLKPVAKSLHDFFRKRNQGTRGKGKQSTAEQDYKDFMRPFSKAIEELESGRKIVPSKQRAPPPHSSPLDGSLDSRKRGKYS